jgi:hypothetical protein
VIARSPKGDDDYAAAIEDAMVLLRGADAPAKYSNENRDVAHWQIVLQKSKLAPVQIFGENLKRKEVDDSHSLSRATEVNLARGDEVPQIITRRTRQRPSEFLTSPAKRLLQHYRHKPDHSGRSCDVR